MTSSRPPSIRHCPLCGIAMQASKPGEEQVESIIFRCQTCQTTIMEKPRPKGGGR